MLICVSVITSFSATITSFTPAAGPVGTLVTIKGVDLQDVYSVKIGGVPAIVISKESTAILAMVMPGASSGKVRVIANGSYATRGNFTVTETPFPNTQQGGKLVDSTFFFPQTDQSNDVKVRQGLSVAVSADGNSAIVGTGQPVSVLAGGGVLFYTRSNGIWVQDGPRRGLDGMNITSVAMSADGNTAISGSKIDFGGFVTVYTRVNGSWRAHGFTNGANVGISADGNSVVSGAHYWSGTAFMYMRTANGWEQLTLPGVDQSRGGGIYPANWASYVAARVAISADGKTAVVAIPGEPGGTYIPGQTNIYNRTTKTTWVLQQTMPEARIAVALSADGNTLLYDNTKVFTRDNRTANFALATTIPGEGAASMSADAKTIVFSKNGLVAYTLTNGTYVKQTVIGKTYPASSVGISADGTTAFIGDPTDNSTMPSSAPQALPLGAAYAFAYIPPTKAPLNPARDLIFNNTTTTTTTLSWLNGGGAMRAVFIKQADHGRPVPDDGTAYAANTVFSSGAQAAAGWYCVYNGSGSAVNITGLTQGTTYIAAVIEYNGNYGAQKYIAPGAAATVTTVGLNTQAKNIVFINTTGITTTVNWVNGSGVGRSVFLYKGNSGTPLPANILYSAKAKFTAGSQIGSSGWYCIYNGTGTTVNVVGLASAQTYRAAVIEYNGILSAPQYITSSITPANVTTPLTAPTGYATGLAFSNTTATTTTLSWVNSNGTARAVFVRKGTSGALSIVHGNTYSANNTFGLGTQVGTNGWYCVYNGTGNTVNLFGLNPSTTYRAVVIEYNGTAGIELYNLGAHIAANLTTSANASRMMTSIKTIGLAPDNIGGPVVANNILSPNGDGKNDTWIVNNLEFHPNNTVSVVDAGGNVVFSKKGYANDWAGTYRSDVLKEGTYYYTIDLGNSSLIKGFFTVVRDR